METTICRELWVCASIFLKYVRAKERKCKDGFPNKEPYKNCMLGVYLNGKAADTVVPNPHCLVSNPKLAAH